MTATPSSSTAKWKQLLAERISTAEQLAEHVDVDPERLSPVLNHFSMRINLYYFSLIRQAGDPLWRQAVLGPTEPADRLGSSDP